MDFLNSCVCRTHVPCGPRLQGKKRLLLWQLEQTGSSSPPAPSSQSPSDLMTAIWDVTVQQEMALGPDWSVKLTLGVLGGTEPAGAEANLMPSPLALVTSASAEHS